jgi:hypothetical protein
MALTLVWYTWLNNEQIQSNIIHNGLIRYKIIQFSKLSSPIVPYTQ